MICAFEMFPSGGSWAFLVGKPIQRLFSAIHNHTTDEISIPNGRGYEILVSKIHYKHMVNILAYVGLRPTSDIKQSGTFGGCSIKPIYPATTKSKASKLETEVGDIEITRKVPFEKVQGTDPDGETDIPPHNLRLTSALTHCYVHKKPTHSRRNMLMQ